MTNSPRKVIASPYFLRDLRHLQKKYRHIGDDSVELTDQLAAGETPGDQVPGTVYPVFKVRLASSDMQRGKSGGFRVIYYVQLQECGAIDHLRQSTAGEHRPPGDSRPDPRF